LIQGLYVLDPVSWDRIYGAAQREAIGRHVRIYADVQTRESVGRDPGVLGDAEVIFSGWGAPRMDEAFLAAAANLKAVFYGAGSIKGVVTDAFWDRGIAITSAAAANAIPVAEYTLSQILFSLKRGWQHVRGIRSAGSPEGWQRIEVAGAYGSTVGLVSLGMIGRLVAESLARHDVRVIAYDPFVCEQDAATLGVELCGLDELFRRADVISLHTPNLPETRGMIAGGHVESMKPGATFINTARGAVVRETEMIEVLCRRGDLWAILDVTDPEPPAAGSPLYTLPNVVLTPHIAGAMDAECRRMGQSMVAELDRYVRGEPLRGQIDRQRAQRMA